MTKKKTSKIYNPYVSTDIPTILAPSASTVPPYEDPGVKYQGYSKTQINNNQYTLKPQTKAIYNAKVIQANVAVPFIITRTSNTRFYCSYVVVETDSPMVYLDIYDGVYNTSNAKIYLKMSGTNPTRYDKELDFSATPLEFSSSIQLYQTGVWGANNYLTITFYGWEEPI